MATNIITQITDDLDGERGAETRAFAFEGVSYEIDLTERNADRFRAALEPFIGAARRVRGNPAGLMTPRSPSLATRKGYSTDEIRTWAKAQGMDVNERGRIPNSVVEQYDEVMTAPKPTRSAVKKPAVKKAAAKKAPAKKVATKKVASE